MLTTKTTRAMQMNSVDPDFGDGDNKPASRFLSQDEAASLADHASKLAVGGGQMQIYLQTTWYGSTKFARNQVLNSQDIRNNLYDLYRSILGAQNRQVICNQISDVGIEASVRRAERMLRIRSSGVATEFHTHYKAAKATGVASEASPDNEVDQTDPASYLMQTMEPYEKPKLFFDTTYNLETRERLQTIKPLIEAVKKEGLVGAGDVFAMASGRVVSDTLGRFLYYPYTDAWYTVTVRDPGGTGSGWAGVDFRDWTKIDAERLTKVAIDKCLKSRNPVAIEPGRYTTILEPQAVSDIFSGVAGSDREQAENGKGPFADGGGYSKIGLKVLDERITVTADPMDPDIGFPPYDRYGNVYHPVSWIKNGILKELSYSQRYGIEKLGINRGLPDSGAYRMEGGDSSIQEMIETTKRGLLVTRFDGMKEIDEKSMLRRGHTRDGLWLIENGKISKAVKNFRFLESPLFIFNNLDSLGKAEKVYRPYYPTVVPSAKVRDFSFVSLIDAI